MDHSGITYGSRRDHSETMAPTTSTAPIARISSWPVSRERQALAAAENMAKLERWMSKVDCWMENINARLHGELPGLSMQLGSRFEFEKRLSRLEALSVCKPNPSVDAVG